MILHLNPANNTASLLSIPRDLFVPLPAHSMAGASARSTPPSTTGRTT